MVNQLLRKIGFGWSWAVVLAVAGCGADPLSDEQSGHINMVPFYSSGATSANPNAGLPLMIGPKKGWIAGTRVEYYDFGLAGHVKKRNAAGSEIREPSHAPVYPMYFFFDSAGRPLFSRPAYDERSGLYHIKGGQNPLHPSPVPQGQSGMGADEYYSTNYLLRPRDPIQDKARGSSAFQRPVIDVLNANSAAANTTGFATGLWEVVEVTVNDSGYEPDSIKSAATVTSGIEDGKLSAQYTGKVINCPVIDERTNVIPSSMANNIPRPRIEVWFRTMLGFCYLANGWETLGRAVNEDAPATDIDNLELFHAGDEGRVSTLDASATDVGVGQVVERHSTTAAVGRLYVPTTTVGSTKIRYANDDLVPALPRHTASDPIGYSPIAWLWDLTVPQAPAYVPGSIKDLANVDLSVVAARDAATAVITNNIAVIGAATKCTKDSDCRWGMQCNPFPDESLATSNPPAGKTIVDMTIDQEGGPRCDVPAVGFGRYCAPGVARCQVQAPADHPNTKLLGETLGIAVAGPTFAVHAAAASATATEADKAKAARYASLGYTTDFKGFGYYCYPPVNTGTHPPTLGGFCHIRCDGGASATADTMKLTLLSQEPDYDARYSQADAPLCTSAEATAWKCAHEFSGEARCGGPKLLGYKCLPTSAGARQRVCMRPCNSRYTVAANAALCDYYLNGAPEAEHKAFSFSDGQPARDKIEGQLCRSEATTCNWTAEFEPRDPGR